MVAQIDSFYYRSNPSKAISRLISYALFEGRPLTTQGRWINPALAASFGVIKKLPQLRKVEKPIFIIGTGRSGTTILGVILSLHRDVGFLNEPKALWDAAYPYEDLVGSYTRLPARYRLNGIDASTEVKATMHKLFGAYLSTIRATRVVDKYPELIFRVPFVRAIFPDAKFIFLVRNGWDTCDSIDNWSKRLGVKHGSEVHDWWGVDCRKWQLLCDEIVLTEQLLCKQLQEIRKFKNHSQMAIVEWILTMQEGIRVRKEHADCVLTVKYEDLVLEPSKIINEIFQFCDLFVDENVQAYAREVLKPVRSKTPFELEPCLVNPFYETMEALGYERY